MNNNDERCQFCRFYRDGYCKRRAPIVLPSNHVPGPYDVARVWWPATQHTDWCGEFERKKEPTT
jgi:hypothetical protein